MGFLANVRTIDNIGGPRIEKGADLSSSEKTAPSERVRDFVWCCLSGVFYTAGRQSVKKRCVKGPLATCYSRPCSLTVGSLLRWEPPPRHSRSSFADTALQVYRSRRYPSTSRPAGTLA